MGEGSRPSPVGTGGAGAGRAPLRGRPGPTQLEMLVAEVNDLLRRHALVWDDLRHMLRQSGASRRPHERKEASRVVRAASDVVRHSRVPGDTEAFHAFVNELNDLLDARLPLIAFRSKHDAARRAARNVFAAFLLVFSGYMVLGGIAEGHSALLRGQNPLLPFVLLTLLLSLLGSLEGLQISVTTLRLKDLESFRESHRTAYLLQRVYRSEESTRRFLAGRQLFVIIVVFFIAQLTSFPDMTNWPLTSAPLPDWFFPWIHFVFLKLGVFGALFALWLGQLVPQFAANKDPVGFLDVPGMRLVLRLCLLVESTGATLPGEWLSRSVSRRDEIPISTKERYRNMVERIRGYGVLAVRKEWVIGPGTSELIYENTTHLANPGTNSVFDDTLEVHGSIEKPQFDCSLISVGGSPDRSAVNERLHEQRLPGGWRAFVHEVVHDRGPYLPGDVVKVRTKVRMRAPAVDRVRVTKPTKTVVFRVKFTGRPARIGEGRVQILREESAIHRSDPSVVKRLELERSQDGLPCYTFIDWYPEVNTTYEFSWDVNYG